MSVNRHEEPLSEVGWPPVWATAAGGRNIGFFGFSLVLLAFMATIAVVATRNRESVALLFWWGTMIAAGLTAFVYWARLGLRRRSSSRVFLSCRDEPEGTGTVIGYSFAVWLTYWAMAVVCLAGFAFLTAVSVLGLLTESFGSLSAVVAVGLFGGVTCYLLCFCFHGLRGKLARGSVALSPHGVFHRSWSFRSYAPWDSVIAVDAAEMDGPLISLIATSDGGAWFERTSRLWKQEEMALAPSLAIRGRWLSVDPALLYHALRYYHAHPEARAELASTAGVQRLQQARLTS